MSVDADTRKAMLEGLRAALVHQMNAMFARGMAVDFALPGQVQIFVDAITDLAVRYDQMVKATEQGLQNVP
jgi:hypothetical protein